MYDAKGPQCTVMKSSIGQGLVFISLNLPLAAVTVTPLRFFSSYHLTNPFSSVKIIILYDNT